METGPSITRNARAIALIRVFVGLLFVIFGQYKVFGKGFVRGGGFQFWINRFLQDGAYPFMVPVLKTFVLPHALAIAYVVAYGELAIGLSLLLGLGSRVASFFGMIYMLGLLFSSDYPGPYLPLWQYFGASLDHSVLAFCFLAFMIGDPDVMFSMKRVLHKRF